MYTDINFQTKKALKEAVKAGQKITVHQPGPFAGLAATNGDVSLEGPHYPEPHRWYARVTLRDGAVVKVA